MGIRASPSDDLPVIMIPGGAHHSDLRFSTDSDPASLKASRDLEKAHVRRWLDEAVISEAKDRVTGALSSL